MGVPDDYGVVGLYALYGGVSGAVSRVVAFVVGDDSGGLAGDKGEEEEEEEDGGYQILCILYCSFVVRVRPDPSGLSSALPPPRKVHPTARCLRGPRGRGGEFGCAPREAMVRLPTSRDNISDRTSLKAPTGSRPRLVGVNEVGINWDVPGQLCNLDISRVVFILCDG